MQAVDTGKDFLDKISEAQAMKVKTDKWSYIKLRNFYTAKETLSKVKGQLTEYLFIYLVSD